MPPCANQNTITNRTAAPAADNKRDDFDFAIVNFPFLCSNVPLLPAYGVYVSQLIRYARACHAYDDFFKARPTTNQKVDFTGL